MKQWKQTVWLRAADGTKGSLVLVAKHAGVSSGTVSNVFIRPEIVNAETRNRVLEAVKKLNYTPNAMPITKMCTVCKVVKPFDDFYVNNIVRKEYRKNRIYFESRCKVCALKKSKEYHEDNRDQITKRQLVAHRRREYGLTEEEYNSMVLKQNNICAICNKYSEKTLFIDHNHETGKVRGLLCSNCNTGIGLFKEDIVSLSRAIDYLS